MIGILLKPRMVMTEITKESTVVKTEKMIHRLVIPKERILISWCDKTVRCEHFQEFQWRTEEVDFEMSLGTHEIEEIKRYLALQERLLLLAENITAESQFTVGTSLVHLG